MRPPRRVPRELLMSDSEKHASSRGFSLIELLVVVAITLVVAAMAMPNIIAAIDNVKLRGAMSEVAGALQQARQRSVRDNRPYPVRTEFGGAAELVYIDLNGNQARDVLNLPGRNPEPEPVVQLARGVTFGQNGVPELTQAELGFDATSPAGPAFNPRGLPCVYAGAGAACPGPGAGKGLAYYWSYQGTFGARRYGAVSISPAGRIKVWMRAGNRWAN